MTKDPRAVAEKVVFHIGQIDAGYGCCLTEGAVDLIAHALADAERRGLERAKLIADTVAAKHPAPEDWMARLAARSISEQITAQAQADKEG